MTAALLRAACRLLKPALTRSTTTGWARPKFRREGSASVLSYSSHSVLRNFTNRMSQDGKGGRSSN